MGKPKNSSFAANLACPGCDSTNLITTTRPGFLERTRFAFICTTCESEVRGILERYKKLEGFKDTELKVHLRIHKESEILREARAEVLKQVSEEREKDQKESQDAAPTT